MKSRIQVQIMAAPWIFRIFCLFLITFGFCLQSYNVCLEYFLFKTVSFTFILDHPEEISPPTLLLCSYLQIHPIHHVSLRSVFTGTKNILNDSDNSWNIQKISIYGPQGTFDGRPFIRVRKFLKSNRYCLSLSVNHSYPSHIFDAVLNGDNPHFYKAEINSNPYIVLMEGKSGCLPTTLTFRLVSDTSHMYSSRLPSAYRSICITRMAEQIITLTNTMSRSIRLQFPYDTGCMDYRSVNNNITSSFHCYDECLKSGIANCSMVPGITLIDRDRYLNSSMLIAPDFVLQDEVISKSTITELKNYTRSPEVLEKYLQINKMWKDVRRACQWECRHPDCESTTLTPSITFAMEQGAGNLKINVFLLVSDQPIFGVSSAPKQHLLDFVVYLGSGLSFWFGFCPLSLVSLIEKKFKKIKIFQKRGNQLFIKRQYPLRTHPITRFQGHRLSL